MITQKNLLIILFISLISILFSCGERSYTIYMCSYCGENIKVLEKNKVDNVIAKTPIPHNHRYIPICGYDRENKINWDGVGDEACYIRSQLDSRNNKTLKHNNELDEWYKIDHNDKTLLKIFSDKYGYEYKKIK